MKFLGFRNLVIRERPGPFDAVASDPVMRATWETPVANGGAHPDLFTVVGQPEPAWSKRGNDLAATAARAKVNGRVEWDGHVEHAGCQFARHRVHEFRSDVLDGR